MGLVFKNSGLKKFRFEEIGLFFLIKKKNKRKSVSKSGTKFSYEEIRIRKIVKPFDSKQASQTESVKFSSKFLPKCFIFISNEMTSV